MDPVDPTGTATGKTTVKIPINSRPIQANIPVDFEASFTISMELPTEDGYHHALRYIERAVSGLVCLFGLRTR